MKKATLMGTISLAVTVLGLCAAVQSQTSVSVPTWHNDNWRTGRNIRETILTPLGINDPAKFGKVCKAITDGQIYAQPLVVANVTIQGQFYPNVVYVVTQNDSVYAFDGNSVGPRCTQLLRTNLLQAEERAADCHQIVFKTCNLVAPLFGILGTPVIDTGSRTMYLLTQGQVGNPPTSFFFRLHALDITTLSNTPEKFGGPVTVANSGFAQAHLQRTGMLLVPGVGPNGRGMVYFAFEHGVKTWANGYIYGYDARNLQAPAAVLKTTPNGIGGGVWQSGAGIATGVASAGGPKFLFPGISDGTFDAASPNPPNQDYGDSFIKLPPSLVPITPASASTFFAPFNQSCLLNADSDFNSGGVLLVPDQALSTHPYLAVTEGKDGNIYVIDRATPGGYNGLSNTNVQTIPDTGTSTFCKSSPPYFSGAAYWHHFLYFAVRGGRLTRYRLSDSCAQGGPICTEAASIATTTVNFTVGTTPSISAPSDAGGGIVWAIAGAGKVTGPPYAVLYAFDALNLDANRNLKNLWSSNRCPTSNRDRPGYATKFTTPAIANGRVYIGTQDPSDATNTRGELDIYGLNPAGTCN
jgi:hypothetical protein